MSDEHDERDLEHHERELAQDEAEAAGASASIGSRACGVVGCLLLIGIVVALGAGAFALGNALEPLADRFLWAPHDVVREYLDAYERGDAARAERFLCRGVRLLDPGAPHGATTWTAFVEDTFPYPRPAGRIAIYYGLNVPGRARPLRAQALIERHDDGWRICALE